VDATLVALQELTETHLAVVQRNSIRAKQGHLIQKADSVETKMEDTKGDTVIDISALLIESPYAASDFISYLNHYEVLRQLQVFFTEDISSGDVGGVSSVDCRGVLLGPFLKLCVSLDTLERELRALLIQAVTHSTTAATSTNTTAATLDAVSGYAKPLLHSISKEYGCEVDTGTTTTTKNSQHLPITSSTISPQTFSELFDEARRKEDAGMAQVLRHLRTNLFQS
jgi:hypothetical protein